MIKRPALIPEDEMFKQTTLNLLGYGLFIGLPIFFIIKVTQTLLLEEDKPKQLVAVTEVQNSDKTLAVYS